MKRRYSKEIHIGNIPVGGNSPITVQSMLNTKTVDIDGSLAQINELSKVGKRNYFLNQHFGNKRTSIDYTLYASCY